MTPAEFKTLMPDFVGVADADIQRWLNRSVTYLTESPRWCDQYSDGVTNFVAWGLVDEGVDGVPPGVENISSSATREQVGQVQVYYSEAAIARVAEDPFQSNKFGRRYAALARQVGRGAAGV